MQIGAGFSQFYRNRSCILRNITEASWKPICFVNICIEKMHYVRFYQNVSRLAWSHFYYMPDVGYRYVTYNPKKPNSWWVKRFRFSYSVIILPQTKTFLLTHLRNDDVLSTAREVEQSGSVLFWLNFVEARIGATSHKPSTKHAYDFKTDIIWEDGCRWMKKLLPKFSNYSLYVSTVDCITTANGVWWKRNR